MWTIWWVNCVVWVLGQVKQVHGCRFPPRSFFKMSCRRRSRSLLLFWGTNAKPDSIVAAGKHLVMSQCLVWPVAPSQPIWCARPALDFWDSEYLPWLKLSVKRLCVRPHTVKLDSDDAVSPQTCFGKGHLKVVVSVQTHHTTVFVSPGREQPPPPPAKKLRRSVAVRLSIAGTMLACSAYRKVLREQSGHFVGKRLACCVEKYEWILQRFKFPEWWWKTDLQRNIVVERNWTENP